MDRSQTPPPARRHTHAADTPVPNDEWLGKQLFTATPAPLRHIAARMNETAVGVVQTATSLFMMLGLFVFGVGVLFLVLCVFDFGKHHVLGYWPEDPRAERIDALEAEVEDLRAENHRLTQALLGRLDQGHPVSEEAR